MTAPNNALLVNASIAGVLSGNLADRFLTAVNSSAPPAIGTADPSYSALATFGTLWAGQTDAAVPNDHSGAAQPTNSAAISVVTTGVAIAPEGGGALGGVIQGQLGKTQLMTSIVRNIMEGRYASLPVPLPTGAQLAPFAQAITAKYLACVPNLQPGLSSAPLAAGLNNILQNAAFCGYLARGSDVPLSTSSTDTAYTAASAAALAFAQSVDALIVNDATISQGGGLAAAPTTGLILGTQLGKSRLLYSIVLGAARIDLPAAMSACYTACVGNIAVGTGTPPFNNILRNAAYCGFIAGNLSGRGISSTSSADGFYVALAAAALAFAQEVDAAITASDTAGSPIPAGTQGISAGGGNPTPIVPSTGTITEGELAKESIMWAICQGVNKGRPLLGNSLDSTASNYAALAQSVVALYLEMATVLNTP